MKPLAYRERLILDLLCKRQSVSSRDIFDQIWGDDPNGGPLGARETIAVYVVRVRKFLRTYGVEIITLDRCAPFGSCRWAVVMQHRDKARWINHNYDELQMAGFPLALSQAGYEERAYG